MKLDTINMAYLMKHAQAGQDPFSADYAGEGATAPPSAPPGSIEAKRMEQVEMQDQQAEADAKAQEAEAKGIQKQYDGLNKEYTKAQQDVAQLQAKVDAFEAREAVKTPGLSPSYDAVKSRMTSKIDNLGKHMRQFNGVLTAKAATELLIKKAWWVKYAHMSKPDRVLALTKIASMVPSNSGNGAKSRPTQAPATPKRTSGSAALPNRPNPNSGGAPAMPEFKDSIAMQKHFADTGTKMDDTQKQQFKSMMQSEMNQNAQKGFFGSLWDGGKALVGLGDNAGEFKDAWSDIGGQYSAYAKDPNAYMNQNSTMLGDNGFRNALDAQGSVADRWGSAYDEGSIGRKILGGAGNLVDVMGRGAANTGDFLKSTITHGANNIGGGLTGQIQGAYNGVAGASNALSAGWDHVRQNKLNTKWDNLAQATAAGREQMLKGQEQAARGRTNTAFGGLQSGLNLVAPGTGGLAAKAGLGLGGGALAYGLEPTSPQQGNATMEEAPPSPSPPVNPASGGRPQQAQDMLQHAYANPGFATNINSYSGYANPQVFPQAAANYQMPGNDSVLGQITNFMLGQMAQPNYQSFQAGQRPFRNAGAPSVMNDAMNAFGRKQVQGWMAPNAYAPPALSSYGA